MEQDIKLVDSEIVITSKQEASSFINGKLSEIEFHLKRIKEIQNDLIGLTQ